MFSTFIAWLFFLVFFIVAILLWYVCFWVRVSEVGVKESIDGTWQQEIQMVVATSSDEKFGGTCNCEQLENLKGGILEKDVKLLATYEPSYDWI